MNCYLCRLFRWRREHLERAAARVERENGQRGEPVPKPSVIRRREQTKVEPK